MAKKIRGKNEGSIFQTPSGSWRAQVSQANGKRISKTFKTKAEAVNWSRKLQTDLEQGFDHHGSKTLLKTYLEEWIETRRLSLRPKTINDYENTLKNHVIPHLGQVALKDITLSKVEVFYSLLHKKGVGVRTIRKVHAILRSALTKAVSYGLLLRNPVLGAVLPQANSKEMSVFDASQVNQFLMAAADTPYEALYYLAVTTGMRQGELLGLKWADLNWVTGMLYVKRQVQRVPGKGLALTPPKTRNGTRIVQLGQGTLDKLRKHQQQQQVQIMLAGDRWQHNDLIFPTSIGTLKDARNFLLDFKRIIAQAGLPEIRFHDLRHTAASLMLNNGTPAIVASRVLGHSKPSITMDIYGHLYIEKQEHVARLMDDLVTSVPVDLTPKSPAEKLSGQ